MATFPAPAEGIALTHFVVASDVGRSRRFYAGVLGGEALKDGEPTIIALASGPLARTACLKPWQQRGRRDAGVPRRFRAPQPSLPR